MNVLVVMVVRLKAKQLFMFFCSPIFSAQIFAIWRSNHDRKISVFNYVYSYNVVLIPIFSRKKNKWRNKQKVLVFWFLELCFNI